MSKLFGMKIARVRGHSMSPNFLDGDLVVCIASSLLTPKDGDAVLVQHRSLGLILKRILKTESTSPSKIQLVGDHQDSTSTKTLGWINDNQILGKIVLRIGPENTISSFNRSIDGNDEMRLNDYNN